MPSRKSRTRSRGRGRSRGRSRKRGSAEKVVSTASERSRAHSRAKKNAARDRAALEKKPLKELQQIARSFGIQFGGLSRTQLLDRIASYQ